MGNNPVNGIDSDGGFWQELGNWLVGKGWVSNDGLQILQAKGIEKFESHFSKDVFDYKGWHTVSYFNNDGELTFHSFKNVDDLRIDNAVGFRITAGAQYGFDLSKTFSAEFALFSVTLLEYDFFDGWYNTFDKTESEFRMDFLKAGFALGGWNGELGGSLTKKKNTGLGTADFSGHIQGGYTSLLQVGLDFGNNNERLNGFFQQHGLSLGAKAIIGIEIFGHAKVHHGGVSTNQ